MIIGLTGSLAAGKGTVADFLIQRGYQDYSIEYFLIQALKEKEMLITKDNLKQIYKELREEHGENYVIETLYENAKKTGGNCVIESLNLPGEVDFAQKKEDFYLIAIDADPQIRYERAMNKESEKERISLDEFLESEETEILDECIAKANHVIINEGDLNELKNKVADVISKLNGKEKRPSWDEYFMGICDAVAKRATCDRGRSGCVIAKDKRLLVTGYVGSPVGIPHCDEIGHQMKTVVHEDGTRTQHCVRTAHAEQNAICQAARAGVSIDGATLYCKMTPCAVCAKMIINAGIKRVVCQKRYHAGAESEALFKEAGIDYSVLDDEIEKYGNQ